MFAVLKTGGKQYRVQSGDVLQVEKLAAETGETVQFNDILMIGGDEVIVGAPTVDGAAVQAEILDHIKGVKTINYVRRRRKHSSKRTKGHRQQLTMLRITDILAAGGDASGIKAAVGAGSVAAVVADAAAPKANAAPDASKKAKKKAAPAAETPADADVAATKPANLLSEARDGKADDLKKISGVGPKLEGLLNENGVFHFDQIAAWTPEEVAYMDDQLSFKGRINRDNWIAQAEGFAAEQE